MWRLRLVWVLRGVVVRRAVGFCRVLAVRLVVSLSVVWFGALVLGQAAWAAGSPTGARALEDYANGRLSVLDLVGELVGAVGAGVRGGLHEPVGLLLLGLGVVGVLVGLRSVVGSIKAEITAWEHLEGDLDEPGEEGPAATLRARRIRLLYGTTTAFAAAPIAASVPALCFATLLLTGHLDLDAWRDPTIRAASALTVFTGLGTTRILGMLQLRHTLGPAPLPTWAQR